MQNTDTLTSAEFLPTLPVGASLTLELRFKNNTKAYSGTSRLIGYRSKKYILIEAPNDNDINQLLSDPAALGVVIRGLTSSRYGEVFAFSTHILSVLHRPEKMIAIALPSAVRIHRMRKHPRFNVSRIVHLGVGDQRTLAKLIDFSLDGCGLRLAQHEQLEVGAEVSLTINGLLKEPTEIRGQIKNVINQGEGSQLGVSFSSQHEKAAYDILAKLIITAELSLTNEDKAV